MAVPCGYTALPCSGGVATEGRAYTYTRMLDTDTLLMKRAFELARQGAGLVSPNPMVGAVLVNDGRIVGEGYHRYDLLKHAEAYAIDTAGELARGATLYCNLEPCCHHGRTPPCTDALIKARIARAVIAVKDPDPRVNGRGIEQLLEAGIEVEVGLLEVRALRLNESYFKFITTGTPFVHGVIECPSEDREEVWKPSSKFLSTACECDALVLAGRPGLSRFLIRESLKRSPHRPLIIIADGDGLKLAERAMKRRDREKVTLVAVVRQAELDAHSRRVVAGFPSGLPNARPALVPADLESALSALARMHVTSVMSLPGIFDSSDPRNFAQLDKLTMAIPESIETESGSASLAIGDLEYDLEDISVSEADGFTELTGYPSLRGVA